MKYPRTPHLPYSLGCTDDDKMLADVTHFEGQEVVITEKLDGENFSLYADRSHARSENTTHHGSRDFIKAFHAKLRHRIPSGIQIVTEYMFAKHSIEYTELSHYLYVIGVIQDDEKFLSVDAMQQYADTLEIPLAPVLYRGPYKRFSVEKSAFGGTVEGFVVRLAREFPVTEFDRAVAKWVRKDHVQTDQHWRTNWTRNKLK